MSGKVNCSDSELFKQGPGGSNLPYTILAAIHFEFHPPRTRQREKSSTLSRRVFFFTWGAVNQAGNTTQDHFKANNWLFTRSANRATLAWFPDFTLILFASLITLEGNIWISCFLMGEVSLEGGLSDCLLPYVPLVSQVNTCCSWKGSESPLLLDIMLEDAE